MHVLTLALTLMAAGPAPAGPCSTAAHRAFDFWAGDWDGYDVGAEDTKAARVTVEVALDGCALYEVYEGTNGLVGRSLSIYDEARAAWHQTWVTNRGQLLMVDGKMDGDALVFEGANAGAGGPAAAIRVAFKRDGAGVRQTARTSADGGKTWAPLFDMVFRRRAR